MTDLIPKPFDFAALREKWDARGLVPLEVTEDQLIQTITIRHNALTGKGEVKYERLDGVQAMGILVDSIRAVFRDTFKSELRPRLNSGHAKVCSELDGDRLSVAFAMTDPNNPDLLPQVDPVVASGIAVATALFIAEKADDPNFDPLAVLLQGIEREM